ncbi:hypothetical protein COW36_18260 [bacterium (Candidatus Blackallbacteria) CG17_big_fil_post_rev_8_21_14_2_50_48_46]|uniref:Uncharacterized protein n=1 Tax=bacterium (Candidatus Blackallbacteria) CG17_big_fil_post_rev_8_21_14_2_50_48_46 TaxID=2014261 RepID=A0A2M7G1Z9_9BACT|nr:MAG: hypothetical protein COW64_00475 [bacterium (Candidatus Blackallbacteria) CG18_big_fil_WC_8_21_14_2_50_49_26]PIW15360.1 MAG: hypothetical protein COW36_18260 [bacterium (Candidatus Blackallbacteria) CG17_big_fil_post_rev_8_21_14_2_50_48_46]PIW49779.1 MAG: hypothetical protein COW20_05105 [bacterium (Candidatus Blackallbacteria) CG13_big_fil_rev_8_21_14_2_50_49_14]
MLNLNLSGLLLGLLCGLFFFWHLYLESQSRIRSRFQFWQGFGWRGAILVLPALWLARSAQAWPLLLFLLGFYLARILAFRRVCKL